MSKKAWGLAIVCIGLFMVLTFRNSIRLMMALDVYKEKKFDAKLVTANDFAVRIKLTNTMTKKFQEEVKPSEDQVEIILYEEHLTQAIEKQL